MPNDARPVRMDAISCCKSATAFSMRACRFASTSLEVLNVWPPAAAGCGSVFINAESPGMQLFDYSADGFAHRHTHYIACCIQIENNNRQLVGLAHGDGGGVHHGQALRKHFPV